MGIIGLILNLSVIILKLSSRERYRVRVCIQCLLLWKGVYLTLLRCSVRSSEAGISAHLFLKTTCFLG